MYTDINCLFFSVVLVRKNRKKKKRKKGFVQIDGLEKIDDDEALLQSPSSSPFSFFFFSQRHRSSLFSGVTSCARASVALYEYVILCYVTVLYLHSLFDFFVDALGDPHEKNLWQSVDEDTSHPGRHFVRRRLTVVHV